MLNDYYINLLNNKFCSPIHIEFIYNIVDALDISKEYLKCIEFDDNIVTNGIYIQKDKKILINIKSLLFAYKFKLLNIEQVIIEYFTILFHELNHVIQFINKNDFYLSKVSQIFKLSDYLKNKDVSKILILHNYYSDEIESNILSSMLVHNFAFSSQNLEIDLLNTEKNIIYYLVLGCVENGKYIQVSPLNILQKELNEKIEEDIYNLNEFDKIVYGFTKKYETINKIEDSYYKQKLCLDLYSMGGIL